MKGGNRSMREPIKVMIAEDFQILLEDMIEIVNAQGDMEVVASANSGKEIVLLSGQTEFDIILMDIEMESTISGIIATEAILRKKKDAKIIFLTAHETEEMVLSAMSTGAIDYIIKGSPEEDIIHHIRRAYSNQPIMEGKVQAIIMQEYKRLQMSEKGLLFFINNISQLTNAEREIIRLLLQKKKVREIAQIRSVEVVTVKTQITGLLQKLGVSRSKEVVKKIMDLNLSHLF